VRRTNKPRSIPLSRLPERSHAARDFAFHVLATHATTGVARPEFICCACLKPLTREELLVLGQTFGCERCVRDYYLNYGLKEVDREVELRRREASHHLRRLHYRWPLGGVP
jgi:hypothetical protein